MSEPSVPGQRRPITYLLHARPRLMFHLGHLKMLNSLYRLLVDGHNVVILLIPYDEHERHNKTIRARLSEEIELTKGFYRNYLGFDAPRLRIVSTSELEIARSRMEQIQSAYTELYERGVPAVTHLVDRLNRAWASPNILFVPKCLAAIEHLRPDRLICGAKHRAIAECFDQVLRRMGVDTPFEVFDDFPDLFMEAGMDRTDSVNSFIDINDDADFVMQKLSPLSGEPGLRSKWLQSFMSQIFGPAPRRVKNGLGAVHRSETEQTMALTKLLANVRAMIPYALDEGREGVSIRWGRALGSTLLEPERGRAERIARQLFQDGHCSKIALHRRFPGGKSGAMVLEVREYEEPDELRVSNVSILKIGPERDLAQEWGNYERLVKPFGTGAFMTIKRGGVSVGGMGGIVYQDAQRHLGIEAKERIDNISALFRPVHRDLDAARASLTRLLSAHLYKVLYKRGEKIEAASLRPYLHEFLPAEYRVEVSRFLPDRQEIAAAPDVPDREILVTEAVITEVDLGRRTARAYTADDDMKLDVLLAGSDEILLNEVRPKRRLRIAGRIIATRPDFYRSQLDRLNVRRRGGLLEFDGVTIPDPGERSREFLDREHGSFSLSPVHGDLHAGNVLFGGDGYGIIDYGKMRERFPSLYDVAYLYADLKSRLVADSFDLPMLRDLEEAAVNGGPRGWGRRSKRIRRRAERLSLFEYEALPEEIKSLGSSAVFYSLLGLILLGRMKFDLSETEKRAGLILANYAFERV